MAVFLGTSALEAPTGVIREKRPQLGQTTSFYRLIIAVNDQYLRAAEGCLAEYRSPSYRISVRWRLHIRNIEHIRTRAYAEMLTFIRMCSSK